MSFANAAMLLGLLGVALPVLIHLLSRRRVPTVPWGAMQFLELGRRARTRIRLAEWLLLAARMLLLAVVALAAARPIWSAGPSPGADGEGRGARDVVLVVDGSAGMARRGGGTSPAEQAGRWASAFLDALGPGDRVALVRAGERPRPVLDPPSVDPDRLRAALDALPPPAGSGDLPAALAEAFRILEQGGRNPTAEVVVLTDGSRGPWTPDDLGRWRLLRELFDRLPRPTRIAVEAFPVAPDAGASDGMVLDVRASRPLVAPGGTIVVSASIRNLGPAPLDRPVELLIDGVPAPGSTRAVGPLPPGGTAAVEFRATLRDRGSHAVAVRLVPGSAPDPLSSNDEAAAVVAVAEALPVLLVDGEPGLEPMTGEVDFLRAALAPRGEESPQVRAEVVPAEGLDAKALSGCRVLVLANVDRLAPAQLDAVSAFLDRGGGVLVLPGDRTRADSWNADAYRGGLGWLPARLGPTRGRFLGREAVARPSPASFSGAVLGPLGRGESPPLGSASLFSYVTLEPAEADGRPPASVAGRLDTGDPWLVERPAGAGRVAVLAGPLDAEGGTLPANPDFVPFVHRLVSRLADPDPGARASRAGEPILVPIDPAPPADLASVPVRTPSGRVAAAPIDRAVDPGAPPAFARLDDPDEPGLYRFDLPGGPSYRLVSGADAQARDDAPLSPSDRQALADGWPLAFSGELAGDAPVPSARPLWRALLLAALAGLCLEVWLTNRLALRRGSPVSSMEPAGG
ncbi:BatA domain-containing protein [Tautonia sociabilis]|uniref:BatA domain-containing protein n=1 Tax=Tautonia sociabilis TaxID=2080755 RepID=UPI00131523BC|nr:BatA domain-containing protein [Tautonia sociabilis]